QELLPLMESYNPQMRAVLLRLSKLAEEDWDFLNDQVDGLWKELAEQRPGQVSLQRWAVAQLPLSLKRLLLRRAILTLRGHLGNIEDNHIESIAQALLKPSGTTLSLPGGLVFAVEYEVCTLGLRPEISPLWPPLTGEIPLAIPGETLLSGWRVQTSLEPSKPERPKALKWQALLDYERAGDQLRVRSRRPGDRFQPLGLNQPKKLQDFMVDAKIPRAWRDRIPLVTSPHHILWVVGWRISELAKLSPSTKTVLSLQFEPIENPPRLS
ncbi:MAG: tRNA lysidine(34) synthetase TilS, partial [Chloroflexi bacterium]|nr:tRNA lysidine(34) synthetase TilS [Chloroflexota bacterium]